MSHASPSRRQRGGHVQLKTEPGSDGPRTNIPSMSDINDASSSVDGTTASGNRALRPVNGNESIHPRRSNAPPPSDRTDEAVPLLKEMRVRANPVLVESPTANEENFSFSTSFLDIGKELKQCNDTLGELQALGVSHDDVPLPELVLVGDQSAGKSSIMSGLANLELPRSEGTCTRCPLHIRVSRNSDWSCRVSLTKEYKFKPPENRPITEYDVTEQDPFYPWRKLPSTQVLEFKTVHEKNDIEEVLRWAQVAILNDREDHHLFVPGSGATALNVPVERAAVETSAKFSPNVISLEIKGPELPNLSFYDMPGIFQNPADARDDYLVSVVRNLSKSYIQRPSAIIMCSMPMNSDAENSFTFGLIRRLGATPRAIGVLTKADLLPRDGKYDQWLQIMRGEAHRTGLGYFITSRPQGGDLEDLKLWEERLFDTHSVDTWPTSFHEFSERCGVEKLKICLSTKLAEEFVRSLPRIETKVKQNLNKINGHLATLPELPDNVELEVQRSLLKFAENARTRINHFTRHLNSLPRDFCTCLVEIKPKFILKDRSDVPVLEISDDDSGAESISTSATRTPSKKRMGPPLNTPSKRPRGETPASSSNVKPEESGGDTPTPRRTLPPPGLPPPFTQFSNAGRGFRTLRQVGEEIEKKTKAGMPNRIPDEVYEDLVLESLEPWSGPLKAFLDETMRQLCKELVEVLNDTFENLQKRIVFKEARKHMEAFLRTQAAETRKTVDLLYQDETRRLLTFNDDAFKRYETEELMLLTRFRHRMRMEVKGYAVSSKPLESWEKMTETKRREDSTRREQDLAKIGPDQFEREVKVVAYVRGYYRLAALRFADSVSQCIICRMIPNVQENLSFHIHEQLGVLPGAPTHVYERLMEEDPAVASKRETLKREKDKFVKALASINALNPAMSQDIETISIVTGEVIEDTQMTEDGV